MLKPPLTLPRCDEVSGHLSEYLDRELDADSAARVGVHLAICAGCARLVRELAATVAAVRRLRRRAPGCEPDPRDGTLTGR